MQVLPSHDTDSQEERRKHSVKVGPTERDPFARTQVREDDVADKGVGEDDEEEDAHEGGGANESSDHRDGQVLHYTLRMENRSMDAWVIECMRAHTGICMHG